MKKTILVFMLLLATLLMSVTAQSLDVPSINVTLLNQDPDPLTPGRYVELRFKLFNDNPGTVAKDFEVKIDPQYPFSLDPSEISVKSLGNLPVLGDNENVVVVKYKLKVDESAVEGINEVKFQYRFNGLPWIAKEFDINVRTIDANLGIVSVSTLPQTIKPGEQARLQITVKNMADSTMKDISLKLDLTFSSFLDQITALTATDTIVAFNTLPFAPLGSATEQRIYSLKAGQEQSFSYNLITFPDAASKVYKVPVQITYYDELGTKYVKDEIIGVIVGGSPDTSFILDDSDLVAGKKTGDVSVRFINKGFTDVKFLDIHLKETEAYELLSPNEVYVGNVDSDDFETADFTLLVNQAKSEENTIMLKFDIEYRDGNNKVYEEQHEIPLKLRNAEQLNGKKGSMLPLFVVIVIGGVVVFYYMRRKKKKK